MSSSPPCTILTPCFFQSMLTLLSGMNSCFARIAPPTTTRPSSASASHQETYKGTRGTGADQSFTIDVVAVPLPAARRPFTLRHRPRCIRSTRLAQEAEGSHGRCLIRRRTKIGFHPARAVPCSRIFHKSAGMYIERNIGPLQPHVGTSLRWSTLKGRFTRLDWEGPVWRRSRLFSGRMLEPLLSNCRN